jgi:hypothetical protein
MFFAIRKKRLIGGLMKVKKLGNGKEKLSLEFCGFLISSSHHRNSVVSMKEIRKG